MTAARTFSESSSGCTRVTSAGLTVAASSGGAVEKAAAPLRHANSAASNILILEKADLSCISGPFLCLRHQTITSMSSACSLSYSYLTARMADAVAGRPRCSMLAGVARAAATAGRFKAVLGRDGREPEWARYAAGPCWFVTRLRAKHCCVERAWPDCESKLMFSAYLSSMMCLECVVAGKMGSAKSHCL